MREPRKPKRHLGRVVLVALLIAAAAVGAALLLKYFVLDRMEPVGYGQSGAVSGTPAPSVSSGAGLAAGADPTPTPSPTPEPTPSPTPEPTPPPLEDDGSDGYLSEGVYIWNNKAFELCYGSTEAAQNYAQAISSYQQQLGEGVSVYCMVAPNHSEFGLPERIRDSMGCTSQRENTSDIYNALTNGVKAVDIYDNLNLHRDEYLYFNTDTHWAPLGAFYAYQTFCQVAGVQEYPLETMEKTSVEGFSGYLAWATGEDCLYTYPDTIDVYEPACSYTASISYDSATFTELDSMNSSDPDMGYSMIIYGDNPLFKIVNHDGATGRKLVVVKDSYGNALAPFLTPSFDEVHIIDFRDFSGNLPAYCAENGITDVLFFNNIMAANTYSQVETMNGMF